MCTTFDAMVGATDNATDGPSRAATLVSTASAT